jgi:hypothetical protein
VPLITKALWLGTAVSGFLLSGERLRMRFALDTAHAGGAVARTRDSSSPSPTASTTSSCSRCCPLAPD